MARIIAVLLGGILIGIVSTYFLVRGTGQTADQEPEVVRDIVAVEKLPETVAEKHREEGFVQLTTIEEVYALPGEFARAEALHALAGRSDSGQIQNLIFEANRIADDVERTAAIEILFVRLTEQDPESALALARTNYFRGVKSVEQAVWRTWARNDFEGAIFAAGTQTNTRDQNMAAQSLYKAFGYMGNATTERIEEELGIGPDRSSRGRYLYQLADRSPAEAIAWINGLERGVRQSEYVSWLAYYLSLGDPNSALAFSDLFANPADKSRYENIIESNMARSNPVETIDRMLAGGGAVRQSGEFYSAVRALADQDLDAAIRYFDQLTNIDAKHGFGRVIAGRMAAEDPAAALAWARANDTSGSYPYLEMSVLGYIARSDPQLALTEALSISNINNRRNVLSSIVGQIAREDPRGALAYLEQVPSENRREVQDQIAQNWIRQEPRAALDWILSQDEETMGHLLQASSYMVMRSDLDTAKQMLNRVPQEHQSGWRLQIAQRIAMERSPAEAQAFVQQYEGQAGYADLQSSVIAGVAQNDAMMAKQMADQLASGAARDRAYAQVIGQRAQTNPLEAARWLQGISDDSVRGNATANLVQNWAAHDESAASQWVMNLPDSNVRDDAVMTMSYSWREPTDAQLRLIASIRSPEKRSQAKLRQIYNVMRSNPTRARELANDPDITDLQRQQIERGISQMGVRF